MSGSAAGKPESADVRASVFVVARGCASIRNLFPPAWIHPQYWRRFKKSKRFSAAVDVINQIDTARLPKVLSRVLQKLPHKVKLPVGGVGMLS